jgi:hypothetical protein
MTEITQIYVISVKLGLRPDCRAIPPEQGQIAVGNFERYLDYYLYLKMLRSIGQARGGEIAWWHHGPEQDRIWLRITSRWTGLTGLMGLTGLRPCSSLS